MEKIWCFLFGHNIKTFDCPIVVRNVVKLMEKDNVLQTVKQTICTDCYKFYPTPPTKP